MNLFEKIIYFLQIEVNEPIPYGLFHLLSLSIACLIIFYLYKNKDNYNENQLKLVLGLYSIPTLILELCKQISWGFTFSEQTLVWDYMWYAFPFQLCTTPMYVSLICLFLKKIKLRTALFSYISYITIIGSLLSMLIPVSCYTVYALVNVHTTVLHLGGFIVSVYLIMNKEVENTVCNLKSAINVFLIFVMFALTLNIFIYHSGLLNDESFNMFYISPYFTSVLPIFDTIQENVPYPIFLFTYIISIMIGAYIVFKLTKLISMKFVYKRSYNRVFAAVLLLMCIIGLMNVVDKNNDSKRIYNNEIEILC